VRGLTPMSGRWQGCEIVRISSTRRNWIRFALELDDQVEQIRERVRLEVAIAAPLQDPFARRKAFRSITNLQHACAALRRYNIPLFRQYNEMAQEGHASPNQSAIAMARVLEQVGKSNQLGNLMRETDELEQKIAFERGGADVPMG